MRPAMLLVLSAALGFFSGPGAAKDETRLLGYEAIPSAQLALDLDGADYAQRAELTDAVHTALVADVIRATGLDPATATTELTPGGYLLRTNASLQTEIFADEAQAARLAAALGYVLRQWSVLVTALAEEGGDTGYVVVNFPEDVLTPALAQSFFEAAVAEDAGLGGGYTAFGDAMIFLNMRDADGAPYSGLDDIAFAARLGLAAGRFPGADLGVAGAGLAYARFVANDWDASPEGEDYAALLADPELMAALDALRRRHDALVVEKATGFGWR
ncbi:hypothetical protein [Rubrimonas cliftonensis]|uniref:Uncharacterized protein n=1 Tax=Rubrimonas cliftonensis TaxID=89524 RepID=A0A1H4ECG7_9RHOB|nr:hypothetical protein [Rubrimonas cliftonensis]SEA82489.1 hypothetical protein SAMN05444370_11328 [Rubrimonas cliftonensis]